MYDHYIITLTMLIIIMININIKIKIVFTLTKIIWNILIIKENKALLAVARKFLKIMIKNNYQASRF
jgi:hypothetical protein